jgi:twinkle protein
MIFIPATEESINVDNILKTVETIKAIEHIDGLLLDPWNEVDAEIEDNSNETLYIGKSLSTIRKFSRKHNIATWVVAHPTKLRKEKNADGLWEYPIPDLYSISGSANWYNKADNGLVVWRDFVNDFTKIIVQKIKFKYYGKLGEVKLIYQNDSGNYKEDLGKKDTWL